MRLLYVIDSLAPGGAETSLAAMSQGLVDSGIDLHVLPLKRRLDLAGRITLAGGTVHSTPRRESRLHNVQTIMRIARDIEPTLLHTTLYEADVAGRVAARLLRIPSSSSIVSDSYSPAHFAEGNKQKLWGARAIDRITIQYSDSVHAVSQSVADSVGPRLHVPPDRIRVIPRGRDSSMYPFSNPIRRHQTREILGISSDTPVILAVGRLEPAKGFQHLLNALPVIMAARPDALLLVAGRDGKASHALRAQAAPMGAGVRFLGHRNDVASLLAAADVICAPSEREGSPGTLIEALAVGCPIVASDIGPNREAVGPAGHAAALLVSSRDRQGLAAALNAALSMGASWHELAVKGRARFEAEFALQPIAERMAAFFHFAAVEHRYA